MFQTKSFLAITSSMVNRMRTLTTLITDYSVGGVARTMVEAPAQEIDELYQQMVAGLVEAVPVATYRSFSFAKLAAASAAGLVRTSVTPPASTLVIPAGSVLTQPSSSVTFISTVDALVLPGNSYVDVPVVAQTAGSNTNLLVGTGFVYQSPPPGFVSASNLVAFINGRDDESDSEQKTRFNDFISTLARGTPDSLTYGAKDKAFLVDANGNVIERVAFVSIDEPWLRDSLQPPALVNLYVHNGTGATSSALVAQVSKILYGYKDVTGARVAGYKAAGTQLYVFAATEVAVNFTGVLTVAPSYVQAALAAQAQAVIAAYLLSLSIGQTCIVAQIVKQVMELPGVVDVVFAGSPGDTTAIYSVKLMPGTIAMS